MIIYPWIIWIGIVIIFAYTMGFAFELWKNRNKSGAFVVSIFAIGVIVAPFFSILR